MKYRSKPVIKEAFKWDGNPETKVKNVGMDGRLFYEMTPGPSSVIGMVMTGRLKIHTLEGIMIADIGDYIIKGLKGEFYACKPDIFEMTYEPVEEHASEAV